MSGITSPMLLTCPGCGKKWSESALEMHKKICPECSREFDDAEIEAELEKMKKKKECSRVSE